MYNFNVFDYFITNNFLDKYNSNLIKLNLHIVINQIYKTKNSLFFYYICQKECIFYFNYVSFMTIAQNYILRF